MARRKVAIFNDTSSERHHGCSAVMSAIAAGCRTANLEVIFSHPVGVDWRGDPAAIRGIEAADIVLVNGEGIHSRRQSQRAGIGGYRAILPPQKHTRGTHQCRIVQA